MYIILSHKLSLSSPMFANQPGLRINPLKQIDRGDSSNSYMLNMPNHIGTHVDAPRHFDPSGKAIADFSINDLTFLKPKLIAVPKLESELINVQDIKKYEERISDSDFLMIKTGFQSWRDSDPIKYSTKNPGMSKEAASYLARKFPKLRGIGLDTISLSSATNREEGREAHKILLKGRNFVIVEDMDLSKANDRISKLIVVPLFIEGIDSAPCTVLAEL